MKVYVYVEGEPKDVLSEVKEYLTRRNVKFVEKDAYDGREYVVGLLDAIVTIRRGLEGDTEVVYFSGTLTTFNEYVLPAIQKPILEIHTYDTEADTSCECSCESG